MADDPLTERIRIAIHDIRSDSVDVALSAKAELAEIGLPALAAIVTSLDDEPYCMHLEELLYHLGPAAAPAIPGLVRRFRSGTKTLAECVLVAIGAAAVRPLVASLRTADEFEGVERHYSILRSLPEELTLKWLIRSLAEADGDYRLRLIPAIGEFHAKSAKAIPALVKLLHDNDCYVQREAATALGMIGGPRVVEAVAELVEANREEVVIAAIQCLGECWRRNEYDDVSPRTDDDNRPDFTAHHPLSRRNSAFREAECDFLGLLLGKLEDASPQVRITAAIELQRATQVLAEGVIEQALKHCQPLYKMFEVIQRLEGVHRRQGLNDASLKHLVGYALDRQCPYFIRRAAATIVLESRACLRFCDDEEIQVIVACIGEALYDVEDTEQLRYLRAVERIGTRASVLVPHAVFHLQSKKPAHIEAAVLALGSFGFSGELVLDGLEKHLGSDHFLVQQALVRTLGTLGAKSSHAVEMLATMVRGLLDYEVTTALGRLGAAADAAVPALSQAAREVCFFFREDSRDDGFYCQALGKIATPAAIHELRWLYRNKLVNGGELREAVSALTRLGALPDDSDSGEGPAGTIPCDLPPSDREVTGETIPHAEGETTAGMP